MAKEREKDNSILMPLFQEGEGDNGLVLKEVIDESYPAELKKELEEVANIVAEDKQIPQLYPHVVAEVTMSQSGFIDVCVQYMEHFTPHRKLRQVMLEMQNRLAALQEAKKNYYKAAIKLERRQLELQELEEKLEELEDQLTQTKDEREKRKLEREIARVRLDIAEKKVEVQEALAGRRSAQHMIKDAMLKVVAQRKLARKFEKEVEESGLSFDEAEMVYYVMYFTRDAENQIRTGGRIDTGTFSAISQLPAGLRRKVLENIAFIRQKLQEGWPPEGDYIFLTYWEQMLPRKTGPGEIEGVKVEDFLAYKPPKVISKKEFDGEDLSQVIRRPEEDILRSND